MSNPDVIICNHDIAWTEAVLSMKQPL